MGKTVQQVERRVKKSTKWLKLAMIVLAVIFLLLGIFITNGFMLFCFIFAGLYFWFDANANLSYEYSYEDGIFTIDVIKAKRRRYTAHELKLDELEVLAPHDSDAVSAYRKGNGSRIRKFDYTSYDEEVPYYTMIITEDDEKIKLLLDLNEEMLFAMKQRRPMQVHIK